MEEVPVSREHQPCALGRDLGAPHAHQPPPLSLPQLLYEEWASYRVFYKYQPIDLIR